MGPIGIKEARKRLGDLVGAAERGETVVITRRGRGVARLMPVETEPRRGLPDLSDFRSSIEVKGLSLTEALLAQRREERF